MKIYLDFDDTILDTGSFIGELVRIFVEAGFTEKDFYDNYDRAKELVGDFDLDTIFELFARMQQFDAVAAHRETDKVIARLDDFVHEDFFEFAKEFGKDRLAMLSFGTTPMQRTKIEKSKVVPYFSEIIVTPKSKEENFRDIVRQYPDKKLYFVEDKADQIDRVKAAAPSVTAMKIERPSGRYSDSVSRLADHQVKDFKEVANIIKSKQ